MSLRRMVHPGAATLCVALITLAAEPVWLRASAQDPSGSAPAKTGQTKTQKAPTGTKSKSKGKGNRLVPGGPKAKALRDNGDAIGKAAAADGADAKVKAAVEAGTYHYQFKLNQPDGQGTLAASYYPSRLGTGAAVVLLVHEKDRSRKDFQDPIEDLQGAGLAEHLQKQGIAVLSIDLRGQGENTRKATTARDWKAMPADLQTAYIFLLDRHNHGELNIGRFGVIALGEGANLVANWAGMLGAASTSTEQNKTDLSGLVLVSPMVDANAQGLPVQRALSSLASRIPLCVLAGERDTTSAPVVKAAEPAVKRYRTNVVKLYPSSLHANRLLRLEPEFTSTVVRFLDETIKAKAETWEPRYNLTPVSYGEVKTLANPKSAAPAADAPKAKDASK